MNIDKEALQQAISKYLGWQLEIPAGYETDKRYWRWTPPGKRSSKTFYYTEKPGSFCDDPNAAWQLVEWMRKEGLYFMLITHSASGGYLAKFWLNFRVHEEHAETPSMAIALCFASANSIPTPQLTT